MQIIIGWVFLLLGGALYVAQVISSVSFPLAQRLGIQEQPDKADPLLQRAEQYVAYWDLITLAWLPLAGWMMIVNHAWWPVMALIGGSIYLDTSGREAAKFLSFRHHGLKMGSERQQKLFFASYLLMAAMALVLIFYSINVLIS